MEYSQLGSSGLKVSVLAMGTMTFGGKGVFAKVGDVSLDEVRRLIDIVADAGVNLIDTADIYSDGRCEEMIGDGRVEVDGEVVRRFGARVDPQRQVIRVDGRRIPAREDLVYVALNPVRARLTDRAEAWRWSSVHAHLGLVANDGLTAAGPVLERFPDLADRIASGEDLAMSERLRKAEMIGRPIGSAAFVADLETRSGRRLLPGKPGPKPKGDG